MSVKRKTTGFTLVELLVTVAVLGILLAVAIPSMQAFGIRNRLAAVNNDLMTALNLARSEAIRRATTVSVCRTNDNGASCGGTWSDGWMVFVNSDGDSPAVKDSESETLLRVFPALPANYTLNATANFTNSVTYQRNGSANNIGAFVVCHESDTSTARGITLTRMRPRLTDSGDIGSCAP